MLTKKFSLEELKLADELGFTVDTQQLFAKYLPDNVLTHLNTTFEYVHEGSLLRFMFSFSQRSYNNGLGEAFAQIIQDLLDGKIH